MDFLLILILLAVFLLPSFFMMRSQRKRQAAIQNMQNALNLGDRVVTASGLHGTITGIRETEVDLELSPGVEVTMEKMGVVRHVEPVGQQGISPAGVGDLDHPENRPHPEHPEQTGEFGGVENPGDRADRADRADREDGGTDSEHPENPR